MPVTETLHGEDKSQKHRTQRSDTFLRRAASEPNYSRAERKSGYKGLNRERAMTSMDEDEEHEVEDEDRNEDEKK